MNEWILPVSAVMAAFVALLIGVLVARKWLADQADGRQRTANEGVRPEVFAFVASDGEDAAPLARMMHARTGEERRLRRRAVHDQLARYEGKLTGGVVERIHGFFVEQGFRDEAVAEVRARRAWRRAVAAQELGLIADPTTVPYLVTLLGDRGPSVRNVAARSLGRIGDAAAAWPLLLGQDQPEPLPYGAASDALLRIGVDGVPALLEALEHPGFRVRRLAVDVLGELGAIVARDALIERLRGDRDLLVRIRAAHAIGLVGTADVLGELYGSMRGENVEIRQSLIRAIARIGARESLGVLWRAIADADHATARIAAGALMEMAPEGPALLRVAALNEARQSYYAIEALDAAEGVTEDLRRRLREWDPKVVADRRFPTTGPTTA